MTYAFLHRERRQYPLTVLCQVMQVSRSGYDAFLKKAATVRDQTVLAQVRRLHAASEEDENPVHRTLSDLEKFVRWKFGVLGR